ncbi:MAG TPA: ABC transporter permease [bacterium]|nr:ABC transporter permease [bacterium]
MRPVYQIVACVRRDWRLARSSAVGLAWQASAVLFATPVLYYVGRLVHRDTPSLRPYGGDYFAFVIVGVACSGFLMSAMGACAAATRQEQIGGTLDALLTLPVPRWILAASVCVWPMTVAALQTLLYLGFGLMLFHVDLSQVNLPGVAVMAVLALAAFGALGLFSTAFVLFFRRAEPFTGLAAAAGALLSGLLYPIDVLPPRARAVAEILPLTHALHGLRLAALRNAGPSDLRAPALALLVWCAVAVPAGVLAVRWAYDEARRSGTLCGYG